jgi:hypothetical protein
MNGMLQHQELFDTEVRRRHQEAQQWARAGSLGRLASAFRGQADVHPRRTRLFVIASPMAVALGILAILL